MEVLVWQASLEARAPQPVLDWADLVWPVLVVVVVALALLKASQVLPEEAGLQPVSRALQGEALASLTAPRVLMDLAPPWSASRVALLWAAAWQQVDPPAQLPVWQQVWQAGLLHDFPALTFWRALPAPRRVAAWQS